MIYGSETTPKCKLGQTPATLPTRGGIHTNVLIAMAAAWVVAIDNFSFWSGFYTAQEIHSLKFWAAALALAFVLTCLIGTCLHVISLNRLVRPLLVIVLVVSASVAHFVDGWGVLIDKAMVRNLMETDILESSELLTWSLFLDILLRGILPASVVLWLPLRRVSSVNWLKSLAAWVMIAILAFGASFVAFNSIYAPTFRAQRELRLQLVPSNFINGMFGLIPSRMTVNAPPQKVAADATRNIFAGQKPLLTVLVLGETARAANFSLGGYVKPTNAALTHEEITYFDNVVSCGTDTATSLPCMFRAANNTGNLHGPAVSLRG